MTNSSNDATVVSSSEANEKLGNAELDSNGRTLKSYETRVREYVNESPKEATESFKEWISRTFAGVDKSANIIEIGSAFGRDANFIENMGYVVRRTDATLGFVELLSSQGHSATVFNLITDDFDQKYDVIFANAVLIHFTRDELEHSLSKVYAALNTNGRFSFSLKYGQGERWSDDKLGSPRFFCYWNETQIAEVLDHMGFTNHVIGSAEFGEVSPRWLHIIATKSVRTN